jgi:hypothetical protein
MDALGVDAAGDVLMQDLEGALHMALKNCDERVLFHIRNVFIDLNSALVLPIVIVTVNFNSL